MESQVLGVIISSPATGIYVKGAEVVVLGCLMTA